MAFVTLLEHLRNTEKTFELIIGPVYLKKIKIESFDISSNRLWLMTSDSHEINLDISNYRSIDFDAIISTAYTSLDMIQCFRALSDSKGYNAYVRDYDGDCIIKFNRIPAEYNS